MVVYTAIWLPPAVNGPYNAGDYLPTIQISHPFSGKRIRVKLLHWSGVVPYLASAFEQGANYEPYPLRIDFVESTFQGSASGVYLQTSSVINNLPTTNRHHVYTAPNSFFVPCITVYGPPDETTGKLVSNAINYGKPSIEGFAVGNRFIIQLNTAISAQGQLPTDPLEYLNGRVDTTFKYYMAVFDIEEIKP